MATRLPTAAYAEFWSVADSEEFGIEIKLHPDDQSKFINELYEARKVHGGFENLLVAQPEPKGTVFIVHKTAELPE